MASYFILDELPDAENLPYVPTQLWLLLTLEVVISDAHGASMLVTYPSYGLEGTVEDGTLEEGYWAPPFCGFPVSLGFRAPDTVGAVRNRFHEHEADMDMGQSIAALAYVMGLPSPEITRIGSFIELKKSPRSPDLWKCYKIHRFACKGLGQRGRRNLADPECRKGYVFLPLSELDSVLTSREDVGHCRQERYYLSKPLMSNVDFVLSSPERLTALQAQAIPLAPSDFRHEEQGLLVCADLAGFGAACKFAADNMRSFTETGSEIAAFYRESVGCLFYRFFDRVGVAQARTAGDGFLAAIPARHFVDGSLAETLRRFLVEYRGLLEEVEHLNQAIGDETKRVGSRLALHFGTYRFGRIALSRSVSADFDGSSVIEVARLEAALREHTKGPILTAGSPETSSQTLSSKRNGVSEFPHMLICSTALAETAGQVGDLCEHVSFETELVLHVKEYASRATVFAISLRSAEGPAQEIIK